MLHLDWETAVVILFQITEPCVAPHVLSMIREMSYLLHPNAAAPLPRHISPLLCCAACVAQ